jgi:hypothetical protein
MELLDQRLPDSMQRAFDRCVRGLSAEAQHDLARIVDRAFAFGNRRPIEDDRTAANTNFGAIGIHTPEYLDAVERWNTDKAIEARETNPTRFRRL